MEQKLKSKHCNRCGRGFSDTIPRLGNATRLKPEAYNNCPQAMQDYCTACYYQYF